MSANTWRQWLRWLAPVASAQIRTVDPNTAIDSDLAPPPVQNSTPTDPGVDSSLPPPATSTDSGTYNAAPAAGGATATGAPVTSNSPPAAMAPGESYQEDDLIGAAEGVFGKGAEGLAGIIEKILKDQGQPNAYISGREASGAFVVGLRYGSGTLNHKIEGKREGEIAGAGLEVVDPEPLPDGHPLLSLPNCTMTPHIGATKHVAQYHMGDIFNANAAAWERGEAMPTRVDVEAGY